MTKAEAKREAHFRVAMAIESALEGGWETLDRYGDDRDKVADAINDLAATHLKRSGRAPNSTHLPEG